jgi:hypothetical protein
MVEEIKKELLKRYNTVKVVEAAKWLSNEMENKESDKYDVPLLTIFYKDLAEEVPNEYRLLQVRIRDDNEGRGEEVVVVLNSRGVSKVVTDIDTDLKEVAGFIEKFTQDFLLEAPDVVYRWEWLGDTPTQ